jgi:DNA-binding beta-propeller fold protein YncE
MRGEPRAPRALLIAAAGLALLLASCEAEGPTIPEVVTPPGAPLLLAVNNLAETLAMVRLDSLTVVQNALLLGDVPNDVAVDPTGRFAIVVDSRDNDLLLVALEDSLRVASRVDFGPGANPWAAAWVGTDQAYVTLWLTDEVVRVDIASRAVVARTDVGPRPQDLLIVGDRLVVTLTNYGNGGFGAGAVAVLDAATGSLLHSVPVGMNPQSLAVAPDGRVHVVCTGNYGNATPPVEGWIYVLDPLADAVVDSMRVGGAPVAVAMTPAGKAYLASESGGLLAYDAVTLTPLAPFESPLIPLDGFSAVAYDAGRARLFAANFPEDLLFVLDATADTLLTGVPLGDGPVALAVRP